MSALISLVQDQDDSEPARSRAVARGEACFAGLLAAASGVASATAESAPTALLSVTAPDDPPGTPASGTAPSGMSRSHVSIRFRVRADTKSAAAGPVGRRARSVDGRLASAQSARARSHRRPNADRGSRGTEPRVSACPWGLEEPLRPRAGVSNSFRSRKQTVISSDIVQARLLSLFCKCKTRYVCM